MSEVLAVGLGGESANFAIPASASRGLVLHPDADQDHPDVAEAAAIGSTENGLPYALLPMSVLMCGGDRLRLEISNRESAPTEAPMTHWYGQRVGTGTYRHDAKDPLRLRLHERPRDAAPDIAP